MAFGLSPVEKINRARADLRLGVPVVVHDGAARALVLAAEMVTPARLQELRATAPGLALALAITQHRAETLKARVYDGDLARVMVPEDVDCGWLRAVADPADDLRHPMKGPLRSLRDGDAGLARVALGLVKSAQLLPAVLVLPLPDGLPLPDLTVLQAESVARELARASELAPVVSARLPMVASQAGRVHVFRPGDGGVEHYAIEIGQPDRAAPVLARLHSACFTGDVLGSLKCDCGPQLNAALARMGAEGAGVLLYLNQEGRGIGLANKMRAYSLQDQGFDTVEANHRLGFEDDERDFRLGAGLLRKMGFREIRLLTNNPRKVEMLDAHGLRVVERVPLRVGETAENRAYLATKALKSGHML